MKTTATVTTTKSDWEKFKTLAKARGLQPQAVFQELIQLFLEQPEIIINRMFKEVK
jgi:hypothetical protein